jgi:hypothetical protein
LLHNATSFDPTMGSSSGQQQKIGDMKCTGSRSVYIGLYIYLYIYIYISISNEKWACL